MVVRSSTHGEPSLLGLEDIHLTFPNGTVALRGVDFVAHAGRVHGLLGANGAGKSTLIKVLCASIPATQGRIVWRGEEVSFRTPFEANQAGIATIHQNIPLIPTLSVQENVFMWKRGGLRHNPDDRRQLHMLCQEIGYEVDPDDLISDLSIGARQMVCILQALSLGADLILMDEPTASLAKEEREIVYATVRRLAEQGKGIIFVSHFLDEIMALTDEVTVLRDGKVVMYSETHATSEEQVAEAIAGKTIAALDHLKTQRGTIRDEAVLECRNLASPAGLAPMDFTIHAGEVVGIAGLLGSGRSEFMHAVFGSDKQATGEVVLDGKRMRRNPGQSVREGLALIPEDRDQQAIVPVFEIWKNNSLPYLTKTALRGIVVQEDTEREWAEEAIRILNIKAEGPDDLVTELSGGNAQKVTVARWLFGDIKVLLMDEPTAGIDVGAKADILTLVRKLASEGKAVVIVSSEFEEMLTVADRILVMRDGAVVAERPAADCDDQELILLASGKGKNGNGRSVPHRTEQEGETHAQV